MTPVPNEKRSTNPFYAMLLVVGVLFSLTACAYCVMAFRAVRHHAPTADRTEKAGLVVFLDQHGGILMGLELALLAVCTVGVMAYEHRLQPDESQDRVPAGDVEPPPTS